MNLREVVSKLSSFERGQTIFVDRRNGLSGESPAVVVWLPDDDSAPPGTEGMKCFLDVWHAMETIQGKTQLRSLDNATLDQKVGLLLEFCEKDA